MDWRNYLHIIKNEVFSLGGYLKGSIKKAKEFLGRKWSIKIKNREELETAREFNVNLRVRMPVSLYNWCRRNEQRIVFWIQKNILQRFRTGWQIGYQTVDTRAIPMFSSPNEIKFRLYKTGTIPIVLAIGFVVAGLILMGIIVHGVEVVSKNRVIYTAMEKGYPLPEPEPPKPGIAKTIDAMTKLALVGLGIYAVVETGILKKVGEK